MTPDIPTLTDWFRRAEASAVQGRPLRLTDRAIWLPLPLDVLTLAVAALESSGLWSRFGDVPRLLDAGMGDGRLVAFLSASEAPLRVGGIEIQDDLYLLARHNLSGLAALGLPDRYSVAEGDYTEPAAYEALGLGPDEIDVFLNYPDGNERRLARFVLEHGRAEARVVLLTPERGLSLPELRLESETQLARGDHRATFRLLQYRR